MADFGPVDLAKIQEDQYKSDEQKEKFFSKINRKIRNATVDRHNPAPAPRTYAPSNFKIVDVNSSNIRSINRKQSKTSPKTPPVDKSQLYNDNIRAYDKLTLLVLDAGGTAAFANSNGPTTFGPLEVPQSGEIAFPYAGEFNAIGKSLTKLQSEIQANYASVFNTAEVSLNRVERRPLRASVIGRVRNAQQHDIDRAGITLSDLLAMSSGTLDDPHMCEFLLYRKGQTYPLTQKQLTKRRLLAQNGDVLEVKRRTDYFVTFMGAVKRPGNHSFPKDNSTLSDFLGSSSGLELNNSNAKGIFVIRKRNHKFSDIYRFNLKEPEGLIHASKFWIHGGDIVYVTEAPLSRWNRALRNILPFSSGAASAAVSANTLNSAAGN